MSALNDPLDFTLAAAGESRPWLLDAADLLAEPDPGPTPWLVENLIVDHAIVAAVGRWKTTKSYGLLDICISIATGRPAFGRLAIPKPGPVVFINEESGRAALWRRLDALCRGRAIEPAELRGRLHVAANARIKLDDLGWQNDLLEVGKDLEPRLFVFDPLARMKGALRDENAQKDMAVVVEFLRELRDRTGAGIAFVHHTGHAGDTMRGSSDLESAWETRLAWRRDGQSPLVEIASEHREAETSEPLRYRISWDGATRSMRFELEGDDTATLEERIVEWLREHPNQTTEEVAKGVETRKSDVLHTLQRLEAGTDHGTTHRGPSGRRDRLGRAIRDNVWNLTEQAALWPVPDTGTARNGHPSGLCGSVPGPPSLEGDGTEQPPGTPTDLDDPARIAAFIDTEPDDLDA